MSVINTNISATIATNALIKNERSMSAAMERLSTGMRINSAKDDAAGLAIASRMAAMVTGLEMASKNANDAISMLEVAEGATLEISNMLIRMRELAVQSASGTYSDTDRDALDLEFGALMSEIDRIAKNTTWNTMSILNGGNDKNDATTTKTELNIQLGPNASQTMGLEFKAWVPSVAVDMQALNADGYDNALGKSADGAAKADGLDPRIAAVEAADAVEAAEATTEKATVTFVDLAADGTIEIGGITLTASTNGGGVSAAELAAAFADPTAAIPNGDDDQPAFTLTSNTYSDEFAYTAAAVDGEATKVQFTAKSAGVQENLTVGDLDVSIDVDGAAAVEAKDAIEAKEAVANESAYGDAVLYWNDNGTVKAINIVTVANSEFAIDQLDKAILGVATERAKYGAYMSRLEHSSDNLLNVAQNTDQSRSRIEDADYAVETSELARTQIISQAATAMLAQANQAKQGVLQLLTGR